MYAAWLLLFFSSALAANNCSSNKCYQAVNNTHSQLVDLINQLNSTSSQAEVFKVYDLENIKSDIKEVEIIEKEVKERKGLLNVSAKKLDQKKQTVEKEQSTVTQMLEKLSNISQYNASATNISKEAGEIQKTLENSLVLGKKAAQTCSQARDNYAELKKIIDEIVGLYDSGKKTYNDALSKTKKVNDNIKKTFQETVKNRNDFETLELPENLVQNFLNKTENDFNQTMEHLKENVDLLKDILNASQHRWNEQLKRYEKTVSEIIANLEGNVSEIKSAIQKYEDAFSNSDSFTPTVNDESRNLLQNIKDQLNKLKTDFDKIDFSEKERQLLLNRTDDERNLVEVRNKRQLIKEYKLILRALPSSAEKILKIEEEIRTLRLTISLYEEWSRLKSELNLLRKNRDEIVKINCSAVDSSDGILT